MGNFKKEGGYTLIIVLLLIVLFMSMSAVFIQGSLSHAKQEQLIDHSNQAVAAAEMGVEYYTTSFEKKLDDIYNAVISEAVIKDKLKNYNECYLRPNSDQCKVVIKNEIEAIAVKKYREDFCAYINEHIAEGSRLINAEKVVKHTLTEPNNKCTSYNEIEYKADMRSFEIDLIITGENNSNSKELLTNLSIPFPEIVNSVPVEVSAEVTDVFDWKLNLPVCNFTVNPSSLKPCRIIGDVKLKDALAKVPNENLKNLRIVVENPWVALCDEIKHGACKFTDITEVKIYSSLSTPMTVDFDNKAGNFTWYHDGHIIQSSPMNNSNSKLVLNSFSGDKPFNNFKGTMVLLNGDSVLEIFRSEKNIKLDNGKICLNLSQLTVSKINELSKEIDISNASNGSLYYHLPTSIGLYDLIPNTADDVQVTAKQFYEKCGLTQVEGNINHYFHGFTEPNVDLDVHY